MLKAYYQKEVVGNDVASEAMLSAQSDAEKKGGGPRRAASFAAGSGGAPASAAGARPSHSWPQMAGGRSKSAAKRGADVEDEDSEEIEPQMNELAEQLKRSWNLGPSAPQGSAPSGTGFEMGCTSCLRPDFTPTGVTPQGPGAFMPGSAAAGGPPGGAAGFAGGELAWTAQAQQTAGSYWTQPPLAAAGPWLSPGALATNGPAQAQQASGSWGPPPFGTRGPWTLPTGAAASGMPPWSQAAAAASMPWMPPPAPNGGMPAWMAQAGAFAASPQGPSGSGGGADQQQQHLMMLMMMNMMKKDRDDEDSRATAKAYRKMEQIKRRFETNPDEVIQDY